MLDIVSSVRVHLDPLPAELHDMGVCDALRKAELRQNPPPMNAPRLPKVAGISPTVSRPPHTPPVDRLAAVQDRLAGWISDLTTLHDLTERLARTATLEDALGEVLRAGAALVGGRRGLICLSADTPHGAERTAALGMGPAELGELQTVPREAAPHTRLLDEPATGAAPRNARLSHIAHADIAADTTLDARFRQVTARLGCAAGYAAPFGTDAGARVGAAVWFYDEPAEPSPRQRHLLTLYARCAAEYLARQLELSRAREAVAAVREELLPSRLPRVPGVRLAVRHHAGSRGGGHFHDVLPLPDRALGLAVGAVTGGGPRALAATGRLRASLRAYAVMEGEDPVAVLSDLELLLRLTEPSRSATALFGYAEPHARRVVLAGAGHCPPLLTGPRRTEYAETTLSAPLGMLACWEAPSIELTLQPGETLLLYTDGLLHRTGEPADRAFVRLQSAAATAPAPAREDPEALLDHVLAMMLPGGPCDPNSAEDVVLLAARF
jgi:serine phosphatase RsbU (regulator of sigma subunit)